MGTSGSWGALLVARARRRPPTAWLWTAMALLAVLALVLALAARLLAGTPDATERLIGHPAPAFTLPAEAQGQLLPNPVSLEGQRGHPVLLVFFYTLCAHCLGELQTTQQVADANRGVQVLYVDSPGEHPAVADAYALRAGVTTPVLLDTGGQVGARYGARFNPTLVLLDGTGKVRAVWIGEASAAALSAGVRQASGG